MADGVTSSPYDIRPTIRAVVDGHELETAEAIAAMNAFMTGQVTDAQIGSLVTALRMRGETISEIVGFASAMRSHALRVHVPLDGVPLVDTCGTGGDGAGTFNISTTASFIIAAAGVRVAKHGNRAVTSKCGSADLLEGLGVHIELTPEEVGACIDSIGIGFMYAPAFHPAMRLVGPARREMGIRTIFNLLGPLTNPAGASHQLIGVGHPGIAEKLARVMEVLGSRHTVLVHSDDGLDELGLAGASTVTEYDARTGAISTYQISPEQFGLEGASADHLSGGNASENVAITRAILGGQPGPRRTVTLLNAGAGIYAADAAGSFAEGIRIAEETIDSGQALEKIDQLAAFSQRLVTDRSPALVTA